MRRLKIPLVVVSSLTLIGLAAYFFGSRPLTGAQNPVPVVVQKVRPAVAEAAPAAALVVLSLIHI